MAALTHQPYPSVDATVDDVDECGADVDVREIAGKLNDLVAFAVPLHSERWAVVQSLPVRKDARPDCYTHTAIEHSSCFGTSVG